MCNSDIYLCSFGERCLGLDEATARTQVAGQFDQNLLRRQVDNFRDSAEVITDCASAFKLLHDGGALESVLEHRGLHHGF